MLILILINRLCIIVIYHNINIKIDDTCAWTPNNDFLGLRYTCRRVDVWMRECVNARMREWVDVWMRTCMDGWMGGCVDVWMCGCVYVCMCGYVDV